MVDKILVLNDGQVAEIGSYQELISKDGPFAQFLQSFLKEQADSDKEEDYEGKLKLVYLN